MNLKVPSMKKPLADIEKNEAKEKARDATAAFLKLGNSVLLENDN